LVGHHWWFPEKGVANSYGFAESNINVLTSGVPCNNEIGSPNLRGFSARSIRHRGRKVSGFKFQ
jgi:hypothetical protein